MFGKKPLLIPFKIGTTNFSVMPQDDPLEWLWNILGQENEEIYFLMTTDFRKELKKAFLVKGKVIKKRKKFIKLKINGDEVLKILVNL